LLSLVAMRFRCNHGCIGPDLLDVLPKTEGHLHGTLSLRCGSQES
jgi:hypothetical protein